MAKELTMHRDLYGLYDQSQMINVQGNVDSVTSYNGGYNTKNKVISGRVDMIEKWKLTNFKVDFSFPPTSQYYREFLERDMRMLLTWNVTNANGGVTKYKYGGNGYGYYSTTNISSGWEAFVDTYHLARQDRWHVFHTFTAPITGKVCNISAIIF